MYKIHETGVKYFDESEVYMISETVGTKNIVDYMKQYNLDMPEGRDYETSSSFIPEFAGRHCYMSFGSKSGNKTNESYLGNIIKHRHFSVLEHVSFGFIFRGCSRGFTHEIVRHRHLSFSQFSTRYCSDIKFVVPNPIKDDHEKVDLFLRHCKDSLNKYNEIYNSLYDDIRNNFPNKKKLKIKKEARGSARFALPIGIEAPIVVSGNLRSWREVFNKRISPHAEVEIRIAIQKVKDILEEVIPNAI